MGLSKFIDFTEKQFKEAQANTTAKTENTLNPLGRKDLIEKVKKYFSIISFYSQKHYSRVERHQKLGHLVSFVLSKFTLDQEKQALKDEFTKQRKRDAKAADKIIA